MGDYRAGLFLVFAVLACALVLAGCANFGQETQSPQTQAGEQPRFGNLTLEQRQQALMNERRQLAENACAGKNEGDACAMQFPAGNGNPPGNQPAGNRTGGNWTGNRTGDRTGNASGINRTGNWSGERNGTMTGTCQTQAQDGKLSCVMATRNGQVPQPQ